MLNQTDIVQGKALEAILGVNRHTSTRLMYSELKVFTVSHLYEIQTFTVMFKYSNSMLPV